MAVAVAEPLTYRPQLATVEVAVGLAPFVDSMAVSRFTGAAGAFAIGAHSQIVATEGVSVLAVSFPCVHPVEALAAPTVFLAGDRFKVSWIHARTGPTQMVKLQSIRNCPVGLFVRESVSEDVAPSLTGPFTQNAVSRDLRPVPDLTGIRVVGDCDVIRESLSDRSHFPHA